MAKVESIRANHQQFNDLFGGKIDGLDNSG